MDLRNPIEETLVTEFEKALFRAAVGNLKDTGNPLRFNNFAYACRELVRHILGRLAPDEQVLKCSWYKNETDRKSGISRKQRVYYAVQGGLRDGYLKDELSLSIDEMHLELRGAIDRLHKYTHIEERTFGVSDDIVNSNVEETLQAVNGLFQAIDESRRVLADRLWMHIDLSVFAAALSETIQAIDELATHHSIDEVHMDKVTVVSIDSGCIYFRAAGSIACELQWGSNSDRRRGDGAVLSQTFPFECDLWSPVLNPSDVSVDDDSLRVDTSSWRDDFYDDEAGR